MRVAGFGLRAAVRTESLRAALAAAGGGVQALAGIRPEALAALAAELGVPVIALTPAALAGIETLSRSARALARYGVGSLAEACALHAAGPGARLLGPRVASPDRLAMVAIAERNDP